MAAVFFVEWFAVTKLGAGIEVDAVFVGMTLPGLLQQVLAGSLTLVLVPLVAVQTPERARVLSWTVLWLAGLAAAVIAAVLAISAPWWVPLIVPGFSRPARILATEVSRVQLIGIIGTTVNAVLVAHWQSRQRFVWPFLATTLVALLTGLAQVLWLDSYGVMLVAWGQAIMACAPAVLLIGILGRPVRPDWRAAELAEGWRRLRPLLLGSSFYKTEVLANRFLASFLPAGTITVVSLSQRILSAGVNVLAAGLATPMIPRLARHASAGAWPAFHALMRRHLGWMAGATVGAIVVLVVAGRPGIEAVFVHGAFELADAHQLWLLLVVMSGALVGAGLGQIYPAAFSATGDTRTTTVIGSLGYVIGLGLKAVGVLFWGALGLAAAIAASYLLNAAWFAWRFRQLPREATAAPEPA